MAPKDEKTLYGTLGSFDPAGEDEFSLEEILAEYGGGLNNSLTRGAVPKTHTPCFFRSFSRAAILGTRATGI